MRGGAANADARNPSPQPSPLLRGRERESKRVAAPCHSTDSHSEIVSLVAVSRDDAVEAGVLFNRNDSLKPQRHKEHEGQAGKADVWRRRGRSPKPSTGLVERPASASGLCVLRAFVVQANCMDSVYRRDAEDAEERRVGPSRKWSPPDGLRRSLLCATLRPLRLCVESKRPVSTALSRGSPVGDSSRRLLRGSRFTAGTVGRRTCSAPPARGA